MAYSPANKGLVLFSGAKITTNSVAEDDTWLWNGSSWKRLSPAKSPPGSLFGAMATDTAAGDVVLLTGLASLTGNSTPGVTWTWNGTTWVEPKVSSKPTERIGGSLAYDPARKADVLFAGLGAGGKQLNDAWSWNGSAWSKLVEQSPPPARSQAAMTYDPSSNKLLVFGGSKQLISVGKGKTGFADTWLGTP